MKSGLSVGRLARVGGWCVFFGGSSAMLVASFAGGTPVPTTVADYFLDGTQPNTLNHPIVDATHCATCPGLAICAADCPKEPAGWSDGVMRAGRTE